jgi:hypothetical protein
MKLCDGKIKPIWKNAEKHTISYLEAWDGT